MTNIPNDRFTLRWLPAAALAVAMMGVASPAWAGETEKEKTVSQTYVITTTADKDADVVIADGENKIESETISITIDNGDVKVIHNGEVLAADRIKMEGDNIILLDEDGQQMKAVPRIMHVGENTWTTDPNLRSRIWVGGDESWGDAFKVYQDAFSNIWTTKPGTGFKYWSEAEAPKVMIGIAMEVPGEALCKHLQLDRDVVTLVAEVHEGLPAEEAGLEKYDIIVKIDGDEPADPKTVHEVIADKEPGDLVELTVVQAGKTKTFDVELAPYDPETMIGEMLIYGMPDGFNWTMGDRDFMRLQDEDFFRMPRMNRFIFRPEGDDKLIQRFVQPQIEMRLRDAFEESGEDAEPAEEAIVKENQALTVRLAELEKKLDKLMKRLERNKK